MKVLSIIVEIMASVNQLVLSTVSSSSKPAEVLVEMNILNPS